jgi:hypothetical protein
MNPEKRAMLPKMAFTGFAARYREPSAGEGFQDITKVDFKVCKGMQVEFRNADWIHSLRELSSRRRNGGSTGFLDKQSFAYRLQGPLAFG